MIKLLASYNDKVAQVVFENVLLSILLIIFRKKCYTFFLENVQGYEGMKDDLLYMCNFFFSYRYNKLCIFIV